MLKRKLESGLGRSANWGSQLAVVALLAAAAPAIAAPSTMGDDESFFQPKATGPAAAGRGFLISGGVRTLYDSNILRLGDGFNPRPGEQREDIRISPSISAEAGLPVGRQRLHFNGTVGRDYFVNNQRLDRNRYEIGGGATLAAGSACTAEIDGSLRSRQILFSELGELVPNAQENLSYGASANCRTATGIGFGGGVRRTQLRNSNPTRELFDLNGTAYNLQLSYGGGNLGTFSVSGGLNDVSYIGRQVLTTDGRNIDDGVKIRSGRVGYQRDFGTRLGLVVGLSYFESEPEPTTILTPVVIGTPPVIGLVPFDRTTFSGLGYDAALTYSPSTRMAVVFAANRNVSASANVGALAQVQTSFLIDVDYTLASGIRLGTGGSYNRRDYDNSFTALPDSGRQRQQDKISRIYASVGYATSRLLSLGLEVSYQDRRSLPVEFSFDSFAARLNMTLKFGRNT
jgi:hypothetical protein